MSSKGRAANVLLVEGEDDQHVVRHLCDKRDLDLEFCCLVSGERGGKDPLLDAIPIVLKQGWRRAVGVLMDADDDIDARWQDVKGRLHDTPIALAANPQPGGVFVPGDPDAHMKPSFGVWLMPDNERSGEIEDFVIQLLRQDDPVWPLAERFIDHIPQEHREFQLQKENRAKLHAWLATRRRPMKMGAAIGAGSLDATAPAARALAQWLTALFGEGAS